MAKKKKAIAQTKAIRGMDAEEKKWRREDDARSLADADAIKANPERYEEAKKGAKDLEPRLAEQAKDTTARARAMKRIAKKK